MAVSNVPVDLGDELVVLFDDVVGNAERVEAVDVLGDVIDQGQLRIGNAELGRIDIGGDRVAGALVGDCEEQLVLDDRAGDLRHIDLRIERTDAGQVVGAIAAHIVVLVVGSAEEGEAVATRPELGVDRTALEEALLDVDRSGLDREFADRIKRNRAARRHQTAGFETEGVTEGDTVNGEAVEAVVLSGNADGVAVGGIERHQRIAQGEVTDVTVDVRNACDVARGQHRGGAGAERDRRLLARSRDDDGLAGIGQRDADALRLACGQEADFLLGGLIIVGGDADRVGAAQTQARGVEAARSIGGLGRRGARRRVRDSHGRARDRGAGLVDDFAAH